MAAPFLKWAGGKGRAAAAISAAAPSSFATYHEPFVGGGAVFFALHGAGRVQQAVLNDSNSELMDTYLQVRDAADAVIASLELISAAYLDADGDGRAQIYYAIRASRPESPVARAARLIFLNKTCYNGLYRVNRGGGFNVPHGDYRRPRILDAEALRECAATLQRAVLCSEDFGESCTRAKPGDFVYLDPPYHPLSATSNFTGYTGDEFGKPEQERLHDAYLDLTCRGVAAVLSNSDHPYIRNLYDGCDLDIREVPMVRAINSVGSRRGAISELLISNVPLLESRRRD